VQTPRAAPIDASSTSERAHVNAEILALGVLSGVRPATSQAAVIALLRAPAPRRTLLAFTVAGLAASVAVGGVVIIAFGGAGEALGHSSLAAIFDLVAGVAALAFAAGLQRGLGERIRDRRAATPTTGESRIAHRLRDPSLATAAVAGVATHVPGLIYLVALNAIAADEPGALSAAFQIGIYNVLWFAVPIIAFAFAVFSPDATGSYVERATGWATRNQDRLLVALFGALGLYLVIKGSLALL
jgi:hypothetical protein